MNRIRTVPHTHPVMQGVRAFCWAMGIAGIAATTAWTATDRLPHRSAPTHLEAPAGATERTLAAVAYGECRSCSPRGRRWVMHTIRNRLEDGRWGRTLEAVAWQDAQYSALNPTDPNLRKAAQAAISEGDPLFLTILDEARDVMGEPDPTGGATHYYATSIRPPYWARALTRIATVSGHVFLREEG